MGTTPKLHLPYPEITEPADVPADIKELALALDNVGAVPASSIPASPVDGQLIALQTADMLTLDARWILRWNAARSRWIPEGGAPMQHTPPASSIAAPATNVLTAFSPTCQLQLPVAGRYILEYGWDMAVAASSTGGASWSGMPQGGGLPAMPATPLGAQPAQAMMLGHGNGLGASFWQMWPGFAKAFPFDLTGAAPLLALRVVFNAWAGSLSNPWLRATPLALLGV